MAIDHWARVPVAWLVVALGCGPTVRPPEPPPEPGPVTRNELRPKPSKGEREVIIGEMCPQGAAGRPAVAPLVWRGVTWNDEAPEVAAVVERGGVPRFAVFGIDGKIAGVFDTLGLADIGVQQSVASGTYVGAAPCTADAGGGNRTEDPKCGPATMGCGLAIGQLGRAEDPPPIPNYTTGGACLSGDAIAVDIDGDKVMESFPLAGVLDGVRSPANEWTAAPTAGATCKPTFQLYDVRLLPAPDSNKPVEAKHTVKLAVLGVVDVDGDGRKELILSLEFPTVRTIVVYTSTGSPQRLELAGEGTSFQR
ncbi:MAG TPA: hypothetical protein VFQ53_17485 [Kofleriaceae bacterium]|nr:hypothetical protein [Kofleriaceae bacterium]